MQTLHAQQRCAPPPFDIDRSIDVRVRGVTTTDAFKARLALAASRVNHSARRAGLRRVFRLNGHNQTAALLHFICKYCLELMPSSGEYYSVQSGFLADIPPRSGNRPLCAGGHIPRFEILKNRYAKSSGYIQCRVVMKTATNTSLFCLNSSDTRMDATVTFRSSLSSRSNSLAQPLPEFQLLQTIGKRHRLTTRQRKRCSNSAINADRCDRRCWCLMFYLTNEAYEPHAVLMTNRSILDRSAQFFGASEFHPADFGQPNQGPFFVEWLDGQISALCPEAIVFTLPSKAWVACGFFEKSLESSIKITRDLMQALARSRPDPIELRTQSRNFSSLRGKTNIASGNSFELSAPNLSLFKAKIIHKATNTYKLGQLFFLLQRRRKPVCSAPNDHCAQN